MPLSIGNIYWPWDHITGFYFVTEASDLSTVNALACPKCDTALNEQLPAKRNGEGDVTHWEVVRVHVVQR